MQSDALCFGVLVLPDAPFPVLEERWRLIEDLGFDQLWVADHAGDYRDLSGHWFDGWTALAVMALRTTRIRVGTLVSNPILRPPVLLAKEAVAVDHLSGGRLELGIGTGIAPFDHHAMGIEPWSPGERATRLAEYVEVVEGVLRGHGRSYTFEGRHHRADAVPTTPAPVQRPRPPLTVAGQSPTVLRVAARYADCWNTHGPYGLDLEEILEVTRRQGRQLDELCLAAGREPGELRRSLLLFEALDAWRSPGALEEVVTRFAAIGVGEFILLWPPDRRLADLERAARVVIPALRSGSAPRIDPPDEPTV